MRAIILPQAGSARAGQGLNLARPRGHRGVQFHGCPRCERRDTSGGGWGWGCAQGSSAWTSGPQALRPVFRLSPSGLQAGPGPSACSPSGRTNRAALKRNRCCPLGTQGAVAVDDDVGAAHHQEVLAGQDAPQEVRDRVRVHLRLGGCGRSAPPGEPHGDWPGHGLVGLQGRPGQNPPLGAQRGGRACRHLFTTVKGVQLIGVSKQGEGGRPDFCSHQPQRGVCGLAHRGDAGSVGWPLEVESPCDAGPSCGFILGLLPLPPLGAALAPPQPRPAALALRRRSGLALLSSRHLLPPSCPPPPAGRGSRRPRALVHGSAQPGGHGFDGLVQQRGHEVPGDVLDPPGCGDPVPVHGGADSLALPRPGNGPGPPCVGPKPAGGGHHVGQEQGHLLLTHGTRVGGGRRSPRGSAFGTEPLVHRHLLERRLQTLHVVPEGQEGAGEQASRRALGPPRACHGPTLSPQPPVLKAEPLPVTGRS